MKSAEDKSATEILVWFSRRVYIYTLYLDCACSQTIRSFDLFISLCIYICGFIKLFTKTSETSGQCKLSPFKRGWDAVRIENGGVRCKDDPAQLAKLFGDFELLNWIPQTLLIISGISAESTLSLSYTHLNCFSETRGISFSSDKMLLLQMLLFAKLFPLIYISWLCWLRVPRALLQLSTLILMLHFRCSVLFLS